MNPSQITARLREIGVSPVKSLGQNFLHDRNLIRWIIEKAGIVPGDYIVEIGPGLGALTREALDRGARVLAIEKDARLVKFLRENLASENLEIVHEDALRFDVQSLFAQPRVKLLGNLPYYISSQILLHFHEYPSPMSLSLFMLQKEMAARLSAAPRTKDYGALTVLMQRHFQIKLLRTIPTSVFVPQPKVDSAIVRLTPRAPGDLPAFDDDFLCRLVRLGFSQRRKQLGKLLRPAVSNWPEASAALGWEREIRAEELSLEQWISLTNYAVPLKDDRDWSEASEPFAVVDAEDRIIGAATRSKVHGNNLRHRAVHILIFNRAGEVLLQLRSRWKDRHPLTWDSSAAGHVAAGEEYDTTAQRELTEELGITTPLQRVVKIGASDRTGQEFIWLYRGQRDDGFAPNRGEIESLRFFRASVVTDWIGARPGDFAPGFVECWQAYAKASAG